MDLILEYGKLALNLNIWKINRANAWFLLERRHTWLHFVEALIITMKYRNGPDRWLIGPQISPWILSRNDSGSSLTFSFEGLVISFPLAHAMHTKSSWLGKLLFFKLWLFKFFIILFIILWPGCPKRSCHYIFCMTHCF